VHATGDQLKLSADQIASSTELNPEPQRRDVYDAPETAAGIVSPAGDIWSIGVTLIAALTQNVAFEGETLRGDPDPPDTVPPPFRGIARECLHLDPKRRCSITEIQARLQPAGRSVPAPLPAPTAPSASPYRNTWRLLIPIAILLVLVFGIRLFRAAFTSKTESKTGPVNIEVPPDTSKTVSSQSAQPGPARIPPAQRASASRGEVVHQVLPDVSPSARNTITGTIKVGVRVEVDPSGKVTAAKLTSPGPSKYFARLALAAAERWEFSALEVEGKPAASAWTIQFRFKRTSTQATPQRVKR
jgi:TonB family protein